MTKRERVREIVRNMSSFQIEKYCSRASVWWESQDEWGLRKRQEEEAENVLYNELYPKRKKRK
jgi:hypothetical protein